MKRALAAFAIIAIAGCTDAERGQITSLGSEFNVTLYSGGVAVRTWTSSGKVAAEDNIDGWYFKDKATGKFVRVSGAVVVETVE